MNWENKPRLSCDAQGKTMRVWAAYFLNTFSKEQLDFIASYLYGLGE